MIPRTGNWSPATGNLGELTLSAKASTCGWSVGASPAPQYSRWFTSMVPRSVCNALWNGVACSDSRILVGSRRAVAEVATCTCYSSSYLPVRKFYETSTEKIFIFLCMQLVAEAMLTQNYAKSQHDEVCMQRVVEGSCV
jgi:hypothetical protein